MQILSTILQLYWYVILARVLMSWFSPNPGNPIVDAPRRVDEPPNIILIGIDTLRADRVSSYGYHRPTTPNLDRLAAEGIRFDQVVSAASWTSPSFASIPPRRRG